MKWLALLLSFKVPVHLVVPSYKSAFRILKTKMFGDGGYIERDFDPICLSMLVPKSTPLKPVIKAVIIPQKC